MKIKNYINIAIAIIFVSCGKNKESNTLDSSDAPMSAKVGVYSVLKDSSELLWVGKKISKKKHMGTIKLKNGIVEVKKNNQISGEIKIDMTTINVTDLQGGAKKSLERHLSNEDFFDVQKFSEASFVFKSEPQNQPMSKIKFEGVLTIKGISNPLPFDAIIQKTFPRLKANASLSFDRSLYDVRYGSGTFFENLGDDLILDDIDINMSLVMKNE